MSKPPGNSQCLGLLWLPGEFAICRLARDVSVPAWALGAGSFQSITRTEGELSIICDAARVPADVLCTRGWRLARIEGTFTHDATGVLASMVTPLAGANVSVFASATFDTDYILVRESQRAAATRALEAAGHTVRGS